MAKLRNSKLRDSEDRGVVSPLYMKDVDGDISVALRLYCDRPPLVLRLSFDTLSKRVEFRVDQYEILKLIAWLRKALAAGLREHNRRLGAEKV